MTNFLLCCGGELISCGSRNKKERLTNNNNRTYCACAQLMATIIWGLATLNTNYLNFLYIIFDFYYCLISIKIKIK